MKGHGRYQRWIDRDLGGSLPPGRRRRLHDHLRSCEQCRNFHDRGVALFRSLEKTTVSAAELDQVGRWLQPGPESKTEGRWPIAVTALAVASTLALALAVVVVLPSREYWRSKGADGSRLSLDVFCADRDQSLHTPAVERCRLDEDMTFAYRIDQAVPGNVSTLTLFGIDAGGGALYYAPTPDGEPSLSVTPGTWQAADIAVEMGVNHRAGQMTVYGLLSQWDASVSEIDAWAEILHLHGAASSGDEPWHRRLPKSLVATLCPSPSDCASVELTLILEEAVP